jgi:hypothetical protein
MTTAVTVDQWQTTVTIAARARLCRDNDVWRVPQDLRHASYSDIFRQLQDRQRQLPG